MRLFIGVIAPFVLTACVTTAEHMLPPDAAPVDQRLLGTWRSLEGDRAALVEEAPGRYRVFYRHHREPDRLTVMLGRSRPVAGKILLELWADPDGNQDGSLVAPVHMQILIDVSDQGARIGALDSDDIKAALREGRLSLRRSEYDSPLVLYGSAAELWRELGPWLERAEPDPDTWVRVPTEPRDTTARRG